MVHFMATVTGADTDMGRCFNDFTGSFIIENMQSVFVAKNRFVDKSSTELSITTCHQFANKILFHIHILVEKFAENFLVDVAAGSHQGKFKKTGHRGWQDVNRFPVLFQIDQNCPAGQLFQNLTGFGEIKFPDLTGFVCIKGFDR